jgi:hypothetical protein
VPVRPSTSRNTHSKGISSATATLQASPFKTNFSWLIFASYWQAKEINRVILDCDPDAAGVDLTLLEHISPAGWDNILLYGEYVLNRQLVRL